MINQKSRKIEIILAIITAAAWIIFWSLYFAFQVWSEEWGPSFSPQRLVWEYAYSLCTLLWGILWMYKFAQVPEWNVAPGVVPPKEGKVKIFSPYNLTGIAIVAAAFAVAMMLELTRIDFPALTIATSAAYFGSIVSFFGLWIGEFLSQMFIPWVAGGSAGFLDLLAIVTMDASIWAYNGYLFFKFYYSKPQWSKIKRLAVVLALGEPIHIGFWIIRPFIVHPLAAAIAWDIVDITTYWDISWIMVLIGYIIGSTAREARAKKRAL
jgi:hypothetical protein